MNKDGNAFRYPNSINCPHFPETRSNSPRFPISFRVQVFLGHLAVKEPSASLSEQFTLQRISSLGKMVVTRFPLKNQKTTVCTGRFVIDAITVEIDFTRHGGFFKCRESKLYAKSSSWAVSWSRN